MNAVFYFLIGCAVLGAIGMAIANRKVDAQTGRQRWVKYFSYLVITTVVILAILNNYFYLLTVCIIFTGLYEVLRALAKSAKDFFFKCAAVLIYASITTGFLLFSIYFNVYFLFSIYVQVLIFDAFSQVTGQIFGKHSLVPAISPAKTIEGFIGGIVFCLITAMAVSAIIQASLPLALSFGAITAVAAFTGDLLASWFKRKMKIKDYSRLLPGQGGVLDRFDSFIAGGFVYFSLSQTVLRELLSPYML